MDPGHKKSKLKNNLNVTSYIHVLKQNIKINDTPEKLLEKLSYKLNEDYIINVLETTYPYNPIKIQVVRNKINKRSYNVVQIRSLFQGICTSIIPEFDIHEKDLPFVNYFQVVLNMTHNMTDLPNKVKVYLTSNETYLRVSTNIWPQYKPTTFDLDLAKSYFHMVQLRHMEHIFRNINQNPNDCWRTEIEKSNCSVKCQHASVTDLPMCQTFEELRCLFEEAYSKNWYIKCNVVKMDLTFDPEITPLEEETTTMQLQMLSMTKQVIEEVKVLSTFELIGSIGGSLGMFFGFSISGYFLCFFDKFVERLLLPSNK